MDRAFTVGQVNRYIKDLLEGDALLCELWLKGEVSNFKRHGSGHLYFSLKDANASINCVMFASYAATLSFAPQNGDELIVSGHVSLYEKTGQYQFYAVYMKALGEGDLAARFMRLRDSLKAEGLFDASRKREISGKAACVALVTSPSGAAVQDMIKIIRGLNPAVKIVVVPALVQGENAAEDIVRAIGIANRLDSAPRPEVLIVGRGGGSAEDLQAFNEESVARAIAASRLPVVSAVGHETDFTIADFVADLRAPTPSAAAAAVVADASQMVLRVKNLQQRLERAAMQAVLMRHLHLQQLDKDMQALLDRRFYDCKREFESRRALLEKLSPYSLWKRGYTLVCADDGIGLRSVREMRAGQSVLLHMQDGKARAQVEGVEIYEP